MGRSIQIKQRTFSVSYGVSPLQLRFECRMSISITAAIQPQAR